MPVSESVRATVSVATTINALWNEVERAADVEAG
jgi:hypothetical protein